MSYIAGSADVCIIGGGHAGCEAALAAARMGLKTILFAINLDSIALMPCNPNIGGSSKGHLVREIDALGGEMGRNIDKTYLQSRMLNVGKGPAVYSLRAQADKYAYSKKMKQTLENTDNLIIKQNEIINILMDNHMVQAVETEAGSKYLCKAVVLCTGTYQMARCLYGETIVHSGPSGLKASVELSKCLKNLNINIFRFKTGTPARVDKRTIDFSKMEPQLGDKRITPFSFENSEDDIRREQLPCYLTYTNEKTHEIIKQNIHRSPMYSGVIEGTGTRYCPSIEDKIVRFSDKDKHQVFIEPEGEFTNEMYVQGMSTSLPEEVQIEMYRSIKGLENCEFMRVAYAIEYDCIDATELDLSLQFKNYKGFFSAGQINGSSGYEEAAAQGLIAGINAALYCKNEKPLIIERCDAYIGVLIDDLVTKGTKEPYRMMTSRAEYRLLLRQDNADMRLTQKGYDIGLISESRYKRFRSKMDAIEEEVKRLESIIVSPSEKVNNLLERCNSSVLTTGVKFSDLLKRPELNYEILKEIDENSVELPEEVTEEVNILIKYEGYIKRQMAQVEQFKKWENKKLPLEFDYSTIKNLRLEARQKLNAIKPQNVGQACRITGVSPSDISVLLIFLEKEKI